MNFLARHLGRALFAAVFGLAFMMGSCRSFTAYCEEATDCAEGNDADKDACVVTAETEQDRASLYGCSKWFNAYADCLQSNADCENGYYGISGNDCEDEARDYGSCMSD
jgi:hypothetical protein